MKRFFLSALVAGAAAAGWLAATHLAHNTTHPSGGSETAERKPLFYQSAMHPWIKSDKPGRCTICGMELTPVYAGEPGFDNAAAGGSNRLTLNPQMISVLHVETAKAEIRPLVHTLRMTGMIDDDESRHRILSANLRGRIDRLHVNFMGAEVTAGQPLADFFSRDLLAAAAEYRLSPNDGTKARLRQFGLTEGQIRGLPKRDPNLLSFPILAPATGTVVGRDVYEGQWVDEGAKLFEIADFSTMWFVFRAYERDLPLLKPGLEVEVTTASLPGRVFTGKITFLDPTLDEMTRTVKVRVELANPLVDGRRELLHKLYAEGAVKAETPSVLTVPRSAVIRTSATATAFVDLGGGAYERRELRLGRTGDTLVEVLDGVRDGESVVTNGNLLMDGQAEMNRSFSPAPDTKEKAPADSSKGEDEHEDHGRGAPLTDLERKAAGGFVKTADAMAAALAADDLPGFEKASESTMAVTAEFTKAFAARAELMPHLAQLDQSSHFHGFADIASARRAFSAFSIASAAALQPLRAEGAPEFEIWQCGMSDESVPGVPAKARWVQTGNGKGRNPFFGKAMLRCAEPVLADGGM